VAAMTRISACSSACHRGAGTRALRAPQELGLHRGRHLTDLVEEEYAAVGLLDAPGLAATAPVKALARDRRARTREADRAGQRN